MLFLVLFLHAVVVFFLFIFIMPPLPLSISHSFFRHSCSTSVLISQTQLLTKREMELQRVMASKGMSPYAIASCWLPPSLAVEIPFPAIP